MLVLVRMNSWSDGWLILKSFTALDGWDGRALPVPVWVPLLVLLVALGHVSGALKARLGTWELPSPVRAAGYGAAVCALVVLAPGVTKTFIYVQF
jgi:hypothetical protein